MATTRYRGRCISTLKKAHVDVIPGLRGFLREFSSERAWGDEGYLSDRGLIPMPEEERSEVADSCSGTEDLYPQQRH